MLVVLHSFLQMYETPIEKVFKGFIAFIYYLTTVEIFLLQPKTAQLACQMVVILVKDPVLSAVKLCVT